MMEQDYAFNVELNRDFVPRQCVVGCCQIIGESPTELNVVYNVHRSLLDMADHLSQERVVVAFDQSIYATVLEIIWKHPAKSASIAPCIRAYSIACLHFPRCYWKAFQLCWSPWCHGRFRYRRIRVREWSVGRPPL